jgi:predicted aspartyl protease
MGMTHADLDVSRDGAAWETVRFLVDSGAAYSVLPHAVWQTLVLSATRSLDFVLADGTTVTRAVSHCLFRYQGILAPSPVVLGEPNDDALLGVVTLENLGLVLNPFERTLRPMRMRLASSETARDSVTNFRLGTLALPPPAELHDHDGDDCGAEEHGADHAFEVDGVGGHGVRGLITERDVVTTAPDVRASRTTRRSEPSLTGRTPSFA